MRGAGAAVAPIAEEDVLFILQKASGTSLAVTLQVDAQAKSFSWALVPRGNAPGDASASTHLLAAWDACWSCGEGEVPGEERVGLGGAAVAPALGRLDLADVLGSETLSTAEGTTLVVHHVERRGAGGVRDDHRWLISRVVFLAPSTAAATRLADSLRSALRSDAFSTRPRKLLVIVCPTSGRGAGRDTWERKAAPIMAAAGVSCRVVYTARRGDAYDLAASLLQASPPSAPGSPRGKGPVAPAAADIDGVLVVGGDGCFNEVLNGLMRNPEAGAALALRLRLGVIPAGSTDAVACTLHGTRCSRTAAAHAALGGAQRMDALRIDGADASVRYASNFAGYGFYGRVVELSDSLRWMGPARYGAAGAIAYLQHASWCGTLEYLPADSPSLAQPPALPPKPASQRGESESDKMLRRRRSMGEYGTPLSPGSGLLSPRTGAQRPAAPWEEDLYGPSSVGSVPSECGDCEGGPAAGFELPSPQHSPGPQQRASSPPHALPAHDGPSAGDLPATRTAAAAKRALNPPGAPPQPLPGWKSLAGPFHVVCGAVIACRNDAAPVGIAPRAALADGCVDVIAVRACSRAAYLRHLLRLTQPALGDHLSLPFVTTVKARAFRFTPAPGPTACWNVDGELMPATANAAVRATVLPGLLTMFAFTPDDMI